MGSEEKEVSKDWEETVKEEEEKQEKQVSRSQVKRIFSERVINFVKFF